MSNKLYIFAFLQFPSVQVFINGQRLVVSRRLSAAV
jgi:hypothetical protein